MYHSMWGLMNEFWILDACLIRTAIAIYISVPDFEKCQLVAAQMLDSLLLCDMSDDVQRY